MKTPQAKEANTQPQPAPALTQQERDNKMWLGVGQAAAGIGGLAIILRALRNAERMKKIEEGNEDLVLEATPDSSGKPKIASQDKVANLTRLVIAGGATAGGVYLINKLYNKIEQKRLRNQIDQVDDEYTAGLEELGSLKTAGALARWPAEIATSTALLSAVATYAALRSQFPKKKIDFESRKYPKRVVIRGFGTLKGDDKADGPLVDPNEKAASFELEEQDFIKGAALAYKAAADMAQATGRHSYLHCMATDAGLPERVAELGVEAIFDSPDAGEKWASLSGAEKLEKAASVVSDPILSPSAHRMIQADYFEASPDLTLAARGLAENNELAPLMVKAASILADLDRGFDQG